MYIFADTVMPHFLSPPSPAEIPSLNSFDLPPPPSLSVIMSRDMSIVPTSKSVSRSVPLVPKNPDIVQKAMVADDWALPAPPLPASPPEPFPVEDEWQLPLAPVLPPQVRHPAAPPPLPQLPPEPVDSLSTIDSSEWNLPLPPDASSSIPSQANSPPHMSNSQLTVPSHPIDVPVIRTLLRPPQESFSNTFQFDLPTPPAISSPPASLPNFPVGKAVLLLRTKSDASFPASLPHDIDASMLYIPSHPSDSVAGGLFRTAVDVADIHRPSALTISIPSPLRVDNPSPTTGAISIDLPMGLFA